MILDNTLKLEVVLGGAVAANQPEVHVAYCDWTYEGAETPPAVNRTATNNASDVTILAAPVATPIREIKHLSCYNKDSASVTATFKTDDGTTERIWHKETIPAGKALDWNENTGWMLQA